MQNLMSEFCNPYLLGNFAPVTNEVTAYDLSVEGVIPLELSGRFVRNGANPIRVADPKMHHQFQGEGMVHGVCLQGGKAMWYRNRWVRGETVRTLLGEPDIGGPVHAVDFAANTNVIGFADKTWALVEAGSYPVELDYELNSVCRNGFFGTLPGAFTAHPKLDPCTGELHAMCYSWETWNYVQYVVVGQNGLVRRTENISLPGMTMLHDMGLTQRYVIVFDFPVLLDPNSVGRRPGPYRWYDDYSARIGLMPREGKANDILWFEVEPCYVFHPVNAYDTSDGEVVIDVCRYERMFDRDLYGPLGDAPGTLDRWIINPTNGNVSETRIDTRSQDFPRIHPGYISLPYRYGYLTLIPEAMAFGGTIKQDLLTGAAEVHEYGEGTAAGEPVFVPRQNATSEDDGWVLSFIYDSNRNTSSLVILDALDFTGLPVATIQLPQRVPFGFHGDWIADTH